MSIFVFWTFKIFHILFAALWFGANLTVAGDLKRTAARGEPHTEALAERLQKAGALGLMGGLGSLVTGIILIFAVGGFGMVSPTIHTAFLLTVIMLGLGLFGLKPTFGAAIQAIADKKTDALPPLAKRAAMLTGIFHLLWLINLALMIIRPAALGS